MDGDEVVNFMQNFARFGVFCASAEAAKPVEGAFFAKFLGLPNPLSMSDLQIRNRRRQRVSRFVQKKSIDPLAE